VLNDELKGNKEDGKEKENGSLLRFERRNNKLNLLL